VLTSIALTGKTNRGDSCATQAKRIHKFGSSWLQRFNCKIITEKALKNTENHGIFFRSIRATV
jgi:hypothetical protein